MTRRVAVLGAGITGLTACYHLRREPNTEVLLFEAAERTGGLIQSVTVDGYRFERGPRSCRAKNKGIDTLHLIRELGLESSLLAASPLAKRRYLYNDGQLQAMPSGLLSLLRSPVTKGLIRSLCREIWMAPESQDQSVDHFFRRHLGDTVADTLGDAMVTGIYAGDPTKLSLKSCFPVIYNWLSTRGSVVRGALFAKKSESPEWTRSYSPIFTLRGGMQTLVDALEKEVASSIRLGTAITDLTFGKKITVNDNEVDEVISTLPAAELQRLLPRERIAVAPTASVAVVSLGLRAPPPLYDGFGYLVPAKERESLLGCVWDSAVFPGQQNGSRSVLSVMIGGVRNMGVLDQGNAALIQLAIEGVSRHMGCSIEPEAVDIFRAHDAIPQYPVNFSGKVAKMREKLPKGLTVIGCSHDGVAVNDCVFAGNRKKSTYVS